MNPFMPGMPQMPGVPMPYPPPNALQLHMMMQMGMGAGGVGLPPMPPPTAVAADKHDIDVAAMQREYERMREGRSGQNSPAGEASEDGKAGAQLLDDVRELKAARRVSIDVWKARAARVAELQGRQRELVGDIVKEMQKGFGDASKALAHIPRKHRPAVPAAQPAPAPAAAAEAAPVRDHSPPLFSDLADLALYEPKTSNPPLSLLPAQPNLGGADGASLRASYGTTGDDIDTLLAASAEFETSTSRAPDVFDPSDPTDYALEGLLSSMFGEHADGSLDDALTSLNLSIS
eukprot:TRINITY_DN22623_c0_g1_i1.p1 TRINITY_DN22623_c0_g1~~TRINITY_DN22623_c0_g1_i1.p1  ORF type:complete len:290 (+),score=123.28 TRINITY_DN22623_c0_g1_i1:58-927(+)